MKRILLFVVLGSLAWASAAQENVGGTSVEVRGPQFEIPAHGYPMFASDMAPFLGTYQLSNGQIMHLRRDGRRMVAQVGSLPPKELAAASANEFVALDKQLRMTLAPDDFGTMTGELLMIVPRTTASTSGDVETRLFSFR